MRKPVVVLGLVCLCANVALAQGTVANCASRKPRNV